MPLFKLSGKRPKNLGVTNGQLVPCPRKPNCVSSQSASQYPQVEPIGFQSSAAEALAKLKAIIQGLAGTEIIRETGDYLYVEFTSGLLGFVDDVEFYLDSNKKVIHLRSASRLGYSDLGANYKRLQAIRLQFEGR